MKTLLCSLAIFCCLLSGSAVAAAPAVIDYQGFLRDTQTGLPLNGQHDLMFRLYGSITGPDSLWSEGHAGVTINQGVFNVQLGREDGGHPFSPPMFQGGALFLEVTVDAQIMSPRTQLVSVPYALSAQVAQQAARADTATTATFANHAAEADTAAYARVAGGGAGGDTLWAGSEGNIQNTNPGRVQIGGPCPSGKLFVQGATGNTGDVNDVLNLRGTYSLLFRETAPRDWTIMNSGSSLKSYLRFKSMDTGGQDVTFESGNVGIGTSAPDQKLGVNGMIGVYPSTWVQPSSATSGMFLFTDPAKNSNLFAFDYPSGSGNPLFLAGHTFGFGTFIGAESIRRVTIANNGNVGIGTSTPSGTLSILGGYRATGLPADQGIHFGSLGNSPDMGQLWWGDNTGWKFHMGTRAANGDFVPRFTFMDSGLMGIGNTSPTEALDVSGSIKASGDLYAGGGTGGFSGGTDLYLRGRTGGPGRAIVDVGQYLEFNYSHDFPNGIVMNGPILMHDAVTINGNLCVTGSKNRIVKTPYGVTRMNSVESAEAWFTKSGEGRLTSGRARVDLSDHFKATVTISSDHPLQVDVTFYGPHGNWYVERDLAGFTVIDPSAGNAQFSWRASARQKGYETWDLKTGSDQAER